MKLIMKLRERYLVKINQHNQLLKKKGITKSKKRKMLRRQNLWREVIKDIDKIVDRTGGKEDVKS